jgi:hypothetical protein
MTERELQEWDVYRQRNMLPSRRLELLLAQVSLMIAKTMGGAKDAKLADYLFDPEPFEGQAVVDEEDDAASVADFADMIGAVIHKKKG